MSGLRPLLESCWRSCWHRARRPVEGVLTDPDTATRLAERAMRNLAVDLEADTDPSRFLARAIRETAEHATTGVAVERRETEDAQRHHDPDDARYPHNLHLDHLQRHDAERGFDHPEWNRLPDLLRPLAFAQLAKKSIEGPDAEDLFLEILAELARERGSDGVAPISELTVFEEIVPLQHKMLQFRSIDWHRRREAQKNRTNTGPSLDALSDDPDRPMQFADPDSAGGATPKFDRIYAECREALSDDEWRLVVTLYVARTATVTDLVDDPGFCASLGVKAGASESTRRRAINAKVEGALEKLRECLMP